MTMDDTVVHIKQCTTRIATILVTIVIVVSLLMPPPAHGQLAVAESGPMTLTHVANLFQQTVNTVEAVFQSTQWLLELAGFEDLGVVLDLADIEGLIVQTQHVLWDIQGLDNTIRSLFALHSAPTSSLELQRRLWEIRRYQYHIQTAARQIQTLPHQLRKTLADMRLLWDRILKITGNKQGQQQIQTLLTEIQKTEARTEMSLAAYHQAMLSKAAEQVLIDEALQNINGELFATMPRRR